MGLAEVSGVSNGGSVFPLVYAWGNNERRAELKGRRCRIVARGTRMRSVELEFENGDRVITSERAVRSVKGDWRNLLDTHG